ncbi:S-layer homology domain-containing protein [Aminipila luticellarii]|uniref:SLH domain-containing protein n=1 Tax=Aminipila luticellarii TaxID=2507160 RepID=A0A410PUA2_9FIRM|nr:S-layer homology domain-containing protein [Aminipila luticellarii]QAT42490.1 hypothetical protein EQM06_04170 [Aminipila luticellarii]
MKQMKKSMLPLFLVLVLILGNVAGVFAATEKTTVDQAVTETAKYVQKTVSNPQNASIGGEWAVMALARSGYEVPQSYYDTYYAALEKQVKECKGILHDKKYTEYSRTILALSAIGKDPANVAGYNLLTPLGDFNKTIWQGINGPIWALIALDTANYPMPQNKDAEVQATRDMYVNEILKRQLSDGGFSLSGGTEGASDSDNVADADLTGMALQALAKYQDRAEVKAATEKALNCLSKMQNENGGYSSWGVENSESADQVIVALTELGISVDDSRFVKNGHSLVDNLLKYHIKDNGFKHVLSESSANQMATEQGFYTLVAVQRALNGQNSLYRMSDVKAAAQPVSTAPISTAAGLKDKNADVKAMPVTKEGTTFPDITGHKNQKAIEALASRSIINGKTDAAFDPDATMTRAEFATIVVKALGLTPKADSVFKDVSDSAWFAGYVGTAYQYKIVNGTSETTFNPNGSITRQEAASMVARAAALCGMNTDMDAATVQDTLAPFTDYVDAASWATGALAFCYSNDVLDKADVNILPKTAIKRCEIAEMLYRTLNKAELL